ncbi:serine/threonine protein phosphatase [Hypericibacter adhaerens]|uniref:Serine/threonine protein phosphatase n=1 Tax=Hypericibacter adhaerens TaxID=2602016 RepID=A0A5J6MRC4_9PROT|nr:serine/threonine protein phosphatase [Hypericibacter adhaerens]
MRVLYYSDIHIELRESETRIPWCDKYPLDLGPDLSSFVGKTDLVVLAGDIGPIRPRRDVSAYLYAMQVSEHLSCPVVLIPGNHEYYGGCFLQDRQAILQQSNQRVFILDRGVAHVQFPGIVLRVLGATLWTDYCLTGNQVLAMHDALRGLSDHRLIKMEKGAPFLPDHALQEHMQTRRWLGEELAEAHNGPTIVVTHHVPHPLAVNPKFGLNDRLAPAFTTDCSELIHAAARARVKAWIYGHNHASQVCEANGVLLMSAQLGYPREVTRWTGPGTVDIG